MRYIRARLPDKNGFITMMDIGDYEYVNPIQKMYEIFVAWDVEMFKNRFSLTPKAVEFTAAFADFIDTEKVLNRMALKQAVNNWQEELDRIKSVYIPDALLSILMCDKKNEQIKALKSISLALGTLQTFIFAAWEKHGFTYSMYTSEHPHAGLDETKMPRMAYKEEDNKILVIGKTGLSEGQIRSAIEQRTNKIARFLDNGKNWHCFFYTYNSLNGKENGGVSHIHYMSNLWGGKSREEVLNELKSKHYVLKGALHIPISGYRQGR